jgi:hypothetical protein
MTKLTKIIYSGMFLLCITTIIFKLIDKDFYRAMNEFALLCWVGVACIKEIKYEEKIKELKDYQNGITETKN